MTSPLGYSEQHSSSGVVVTGDLSDPDATSICAVSQRSTVYRADLLPGPVRIYHYDGNRGTYVVRNVRNVIISGAEKEAVVAVGYCSEIGSLILFAAGDKIFCHSSRLDTFEVR
jgi:hypothetical protein